ncbi:MAG: AAA family ATPase [Lachnospiraceae bacterium]|nr:AAA family ATPase [Lachnospiraceae bacterium]
MTNTVGIGIQDFLKLRENHNFYIDKTSFIKEWWESGDDVTLITRLRRFGKTLNMSMVEECLCETVEKAIAQIEEKQYETDLIARGILKEKIRKYGFAFEGKNVLIGA